MVSIRLLEIVENSDRMTEEEIIQELQLCQIDIIKDWPEVSKSIRLLEAIVDGDWDTVNAIRNE